MRNMSYNHVPYYHGTISRATAENILRDKASGSFLLRKKLRDVDSYAISMILKDKILHYSVDRSEQTHLYSVSHGSAHATPVLLCEHYMNENSGLKGRLLYPVPCTTRQQSPSTVSHAVQVSTASYQPNHSCYEEHDWFHGNITRQEDTKRLSNTYYATKQNGIFLVRAKDHRKFVLSVVHLQKVHRYIITEDPVTGEFSLDEKYKKHKFNSLEELLEFHKLNPPEETGLHCKLTVPCRRASSNSDEDSPSGNDGGIIGSVKNLAVSLASELKSMLPSNSLDMNWSDTSIPKLSSADSDQLSSATSFEESTFKRFNRQSLPKESIGYHSPYRNWKGTKNGKYGLAPDLYVSRDKIQIGEVLGNGHFGCVRMGECRIFEENIPCAIKILSGKDIQANKADLLKEASVMQGLDHPYLVRLLAVCDPGTEEGNLMILLELAPLGTLKDFIKRHNEKTFPENRILLLMNQVCEGMAYLARQNIVHRDLAARNILLVTEKFAKISDFGMSRILHDTEDYYKASKPGSWPLRWYAPEALLYFKFTSKGDVWSFGITLWEVLSYGSRPYKGLKGREVIHMLECEKRLECPTSCSPGVYSLLLQCWAYEPENRPTFNSLLNLFQQLLKN